MNLFDFNKYPLSNKNYGGSERKAGIIIDQDFYMLKFRKHTAFGIRFNDISEYIGSHIYQLLGINCQETYLGTYDNKNVVSCKDFVQNGYIFVPFNDVGESTIEEDKEKFQYSYSHILELLRANKKLTNVKETITSFFDIYIVDAFLGNFDRHGSNWGFLKKDNKYTLAPVFDNGSCLYPNMTDEDEMKSIINDEKEIDKRVYEFPTSQIKLNGKKSSYFKVISSLKFKKINESLKRIYPRINLGQIFKLIDDIQIISDVHKEFYKVMLKARYEKIIKYSYLKLSGEIKWRLIVQRL